MTVVLADRPVRGEARRRRTRGAIVKAAREVMEEQGFAATTIEAIISRAGVARASYYAHFQDKADVARAIADPMWERAENIYVRFSELDRVDPVLIRSWLQMVNKLWTRHCRELLTLLRDFPAQIAADSTHHMDSFVRHLTSNQTLWACSPAVAKCRAHLLIQQLERAMLDLHRGNWNVDEAMLIDQLVHVWHDALTRP